MKQQKPVFTSVLSPGIFAVAAVLIAGLCPTQTPAQAASSASTSGPLASVKKPGAGDDSLRQAIDHLRAEAGKLRSEADAINDSVKHLEVRLVIDRHRAENPGRAKDTIQLLSKEGADAFLESLRGKKRSTRERGYGGGVGPTPGIFLVNMRPVRDLLGVLETGSDFNHISFPVEKPWENFFLMGITGYGALGSGLRIGGSYRGGSKSYTSRTADSTYSIELRTRFGGLLIEKALVAGNFNWLLGGMVGGSSIDITPSKVSNSVTSLSGITKLSDAIPRKYTTLSAPGLLLELHGGFTYTMINWFHVGMDLSTPVFFAPSGFRTPSDQSITNGFVTINPGLRIRIILGNIG